MTWFKPHSLLDRTFAISVTLKGLDGVLEIVVGFMLLFVSPATLSNLVMGLTQYELFEDPHDIIVSYLMRSVHGLTSSSVLFGAFYLLSHGLVKVVLVTAVLRGKLWAYPWMIGFLALFILYQLYLMMTAAASIALVALTVFDLFVAWLTYLEYRKQQTRRADYGA